jgi:hypothetical protein
MRAEKFLEKLEYNTIIIKTFEIKKKISFDIDLLLNTLEEVVGDDYEAQYEAGVTYDYSDNWYCVNVDKVIDKFREYKEETEDETYTLDRVDKCMVFLTDFEGFIIFNND